MAGSNAVVVKFIADTKGMQQGIDRVNGQLSGFSKAMRGVGVAVAGAFAASKVIEFGKEMVNLASNMEQVSGAADTLFGTASAKKVQEWAQGAADALGLSEAAAISTANTFAVSGKAIGLAGDDLVEFTQELTVTAADLGAAFGTTEGAVTAIGAALRGEFDPLERYGIQLNATSLAAYAAEQGISGAYNTLDNATKQGIIAQAIQDQTDLLGVTGQFAKESDTYAQKVQVLGAKWENLQVAIGEKLLPVLVELLEVLISAVDAVSELGDFLERNKTVIEKIAVAVGVFTVAVIANKVAVSGAAIANGVYSASVLGLVRAIDLATAAQARFNAMVRANPYVIAATAIAFWVAETQNLTREFIKARKEGKKFGDIVKDEFNGIEDVFRTSAILAGAVGATFYEIGQDISEGWKETQDQVFETSKAGARATAGTWSDANGQIVGSTYQAANGIADAFTQAARIAGNAAEQTRKAWETGQSSYTSAVSGTVLGAIQQAGLEDARKGFDRTFDEIVAGPLENAFSKGASSGGSKAVEETKKIGKKLVIELDNVSVELGKKLQKVDASVATEFESRVKSLEAATKNYDTVVSESLERVAEKLEEQRKSLSDTFLGFNLDDFIKVEDDGTTIFDTAAFDKYFTDKDAIAGRLGQLVGVVDPIWIQQIAGMGVDSANATLNYLLGLDSAGNLTATNAQTSFDNLVKNVDDKLAVPFALTFEKIYKDAEADGIKAAKAELDRQAADFKTFSKKKLKHVVPVTIKYKGDFSEAGPAYTPGSGFSYTVASSAAVKEIQKYESRNSALWRSRL